MPPKRRHPPPRRPRRDPPNLIALRAQHAAAVESKTAVEERPARVTIPPSVPVVQLAALINMSTAELMGEFFRKGFVTNINAVLDFETASRLLADLKIECRLAQAPEAIAVEAPATVEIPEPEGDTAPRPPVITVMGHVDHGKTTLLDAIRKTNVAAGEVGGITQSIGAYQVKVGDHTLTFVDTPGHEAFTAMRARGAQVTDLVVLVVAADDGVMPQTREAIGHAKAAGVPIVVAVNKVDLPGANVQRTLAQLADAGLQVESLGGDVVHVEVSAQKRTRIDDLLEMVVLTAQLEEPVARITGHGRGTVIETRLDRSMGPVTSVLVTAGQLQVGDAIVVGSEFGRVRALLDSSGQRLKLATPSQPVAVIGLGGLPRPGDPLAVIGTDKLAKQIADGRRQRAEREGGSVAIRMGLEELALQLSKGEIQQLNLIVKAETDGSAEAVVQAVSSLGSEASKANVVYSGVGTVSESDVNLATAAKGVVLGFNVKPNPAAVILAEANGVDIRTYQIIYELIDDVERTLEGRLKPEIREVIDGRLEVRGIFRSERNLKIIGGVVLSGKIARGVGVRVMRGQEVVAVGRVETLRRFAEPASEVAAGYECGLGISVQPPVELRDVLETFHAEEVRRGR